MLCMSHRNEYFCTVIMFVMSYEHQFISSTYTSMIYLCTRSHMHKPTDSLGTTIRLGVRQNFCTAVMFLFAILRKHYLHKSCMIFRALLPYLISELLSHEFTNPPCCYYWLYRIKKHIIHMSATDIVNAKLCEHAVSKVEIQTHTNTHMGSIVTSEAYFLSFLDTEERQFTKTGNWYNTQSVGERQTRQYISSLLSM